MARRLQQPGTPTHQILSPDARKRQARRRKREDQAVQQKHGPVITRKLETPSPTP